MEMEIIEILMDKNYPSNKIKEYLTAEELAIPNFASRKRREVREIAGAYIASEVDRIVKEFLDDETITIVGRTTHEYKKGGGSSTYNNITQKRDKGVRTLSYEDIMGILEQFNIPYFKKDIIGKAYDVLREQDLQVNCRGQRTGDRRQKLSSVWE